MTRKSDLTKEAFMKAADELFTRHGYHNVSVEKICLRADKAKGLFFYHFDKKENIVKAIADRQIKFMSGLLSDRLAELDTSPAEKMNFLMNMLISKESAGPGVMYYFKNDPIPDWLDSYAKILKDEYVFPVIYSLVKEGMEKGEFIYCSRETTEIIYLGISQFIHRHYDRMEEPDFYRSAADAIGRTLETALGSPEGSIRIR